MHVKHAYANRTQQYATGLDGCPAMRVRNQCGRIIIVRSVFGVWTPPVAGSLNMERLCALFGTPSAAAAGRGAVAVE